MNQTLRILLSAGWPAQDVSCEWVLVDAAGNQLQRGQSEPRHWPAADDCEIVLSAEQCLLLRTQLPKVAKSRLAEVISYALEDHLIGDAEADHFVPGDADGDGSTPVWVVSRARLRALLAALSAVGRAPRRAYSEVQLLPRRAGCWSVCLRAANGGSDSDGAISGFARTGVEDGFAFLDLADSTLETPPFELSLALESARSAGKLPESIDLYLSPGTAAWAARTVSAWQDALGVAVRHAGDYVWYESHGAALAARNLLINEFAPARRPQEGLGTFRPAIALAVATGLLFALFTLGEWVWLSRQSSQLQAQMAATFRNAFPQVQAVVSPPLQMQRLHDQLRREHGQLGSSDFLPLLAAASEVTAGQGRFSSLSYDEGRLEISIGLPRAEHAGSIESSMKSRGLAVTVRGTRPAANGQGVEATFSLRGVQ